MVILESNGKKTSQENGHPPDENIKNVLRTTMLQEKLSALSIMYIKSNKHHSL
jgi:hypothetical protein